MLGGALSNQIRRQVEHVLPVSRMQRHLENLSRSKYRYNKEKNTVILRTYMKRRITNLRKRNGKVYLILPVLDLLERSWAEESSFPATI